MSRHHRQVRFLAILARLGWQRDPDLWTIPCLNGHGRRAHLRVRIGLGWVRLDCPTPGPLYLNSFHALRLRVAIRDAVGNLALFSGTGPPERPTRPKPAPEDPGVPLRRQLVVLHRPPPRPTVADIAARLANPADQETDCDDHCAHLRRTTGLAEAFPAWFVQRHPLPVSGFQEIPQPTEPALILLELDADGTTAPKKSSLADCTFDPPIRT